MEQVGAVNGRAGSAGLTWHCLQIGDQVVAVCAQWSKVGHAAAPLQRQNSTAQGGATGGSVHQGRRGQCSATSGTALRNVWLAAYTAHHTPCRRLITSPPPGQAPVKPLVKPQVKPQVKPESKGLTCSSMR